MYERLERLKTAGLNKFGEWNIDNVHPMEPKKKKTRTKNKKKFATMDFETDNIEAGKTPNIRYFTAAIPKTKNNKYQKPVPKTIGRKVTDGKQLTDILEELFLGDKHKPSMIITWNVQYEYGIIIRHCLDELIARGYRIKNNEAFFSIEWQEYHPKKKKYEWRKAIFADGMRVTGLMGIKLKDFMCEFAPDKVDSKENIDFNIEEFDADNPEHIEYAKNDSEGLWYAMKGFQNMLLKECGVDISVTIGNTAMQYVKSMIDKKVPQISRNADTCFRLSFRGGINYAELFKGSCRKYDANKMYPSTYFKPLGIRPVFTNIYRDDKQGIYYVYILNEHFRFPIPVRCEKNERLTSRELKQGDSEITCLTGEEIDFLSNNGCYIKVLEGYYFADELDLSFIPNKMQEIIDKEKPKSLREKIMKLIGNTIFGKTGEKPVTRSKMMFTEEQAVEYLHETLEYYKKQGLEELGKKLVSEMELMMYEGEEYIGYLETIEYNQKAHMHPELASQITARARVKLMASGLELERKENRRVFYMDTDCIGVSGDFDAECLEMSKTKIGAWKDEKAKYMIVTGKKQYAIIEYDDSYTFGSKGVNLAGLNMSDDEIFEMYNRMYEGETWNITQIQKRMDINNHMFTTVNKNIKATADN